jgi:hypothetical protein
VKVKKSDSFQVPKPKRASGIPLAANGFRPMTSQNSTRNSQERVVGTAGNLISASLAAAHNQTTSSVNVKSKSRASSARKNQNATSSYSAVKKPPQTFSEKDLLMISSPHSPSASKNLSKLISAGATPQGSSPS